jgi:hypothetical protein
LSCAITLAATSLHAGLAHRDDMCRRPHHFEEADQVIDVIVEAELSLRLRNVACVVPVGDEHVVLWQHRAHGRAQQRREMPGERRNDQHLRLRLVDVLLEMQQRAEWRLVGCLFLHLDVAIADTDV